jgi:ribosomal protein L7/L12
VSRKETAQSIKESLTELGVNVSVTHDKRSEAKAEAESIKESLTELGVNAKVTQK